MQQNTALKPKDEATEIPFVNPSRFTSTDWPGYAEWIFPRIKDLLPNMAPRAVSGWIMGLSDNNECCFIKTKYAVGMAEMVHLPMDPQVRVRVVFCFAKDGDEDSILEAAALYREFAKWAKSLQSPEMAVDGVSDVPAPLIQKACGKPLLERRSKYVEITR